jgi:hypothetical protein
MSEKPTDLSIPNDPIAIKEGETGTTQPESQPQPQPPVNTRFRTPVRARKGGCRYCNKKK